MEPNDASVTETTLGGGSPESRVFGWPSDLDADYELLGELGRGGMAVVYRARDRELGREVAVKVVRPRYAADEDAVARLAREARTVAQLEHPNIVGLYAVKRLPDSTLALVMQLVPGYTLKAALEAEGPFPPAKAEKVLRDIARALAYAHRCGVVHRDVKPENIFLDGATGRALLSDFGVARQLNQNTDLTATGTAIGTPTYMAPEQIDGVRVDGRSDLYSLGLVGWELLTGQRPWAGESLYTVIYRQKHDPLPPVDWFRDDVPSRLQYLIEGLLPKNPDRRWSSAARFLSLMASEAELPGFKEWQVAQRRRKRQRVYDEARARGSNPIAAAYETVRFNRGETPISTPTLPAEDDDQPPPELPLEAEDHRIPSPFEHEIIPGDGPVPSRRRLQAALLVLTLLGGAAAIGSVILRARASNAPLASASTLNDKSGIEVPVIPAPDSSRRDSVIAAGRLDSIPPATDSAQKPAAIVDTTKRAPVQVAVVPPPAPVPVRDTARAKPATSLKPDSLIAVVPAAPPAPTVAFSSDRLLVAAGGRHSCVIGDAGKAYCWGNNERGQLGDGSFEGRQTPASVVSDAAFTQIAAGIWHTCAITSGGEVYCWGSNDAGQLGDGTTAPRATPAHVGSTAFRTIRTGQSHTCGLSRSGTVLCWGANAYGQLGDGTRSTKTSPSAVTLPLPGGAVTAGWTHSCALTTDGTAYCWGRNSAGQLGDGTTTDRATPAPVSTALKFVSIAAGREHTCAVATNGSVHCWGRNTYGQLGTGSTTPASATSPVETDADGPVSVVVAGADHTCARTRDGRALCWGRNVYGQVGDGSSSDRARPVAPRGGLSFTALNASASHTCGVTSTGDTYCWGFNIDGQLGSGNSDNAVAPVKVSAPSR
ncbi:MAG: protein kinase [Gemmatimonadaceae bacterium]